MNRGTWKQGERRVAKFFGTVRTPLSGGNGGITRSDTRHDKLFIEQRHRKAHAVRTLYDTVSVLAKRENKIPVVTLMDKSKKGFLIVVHTDNLDEFIKAYQKSK